MKNKYYISLLAFLLISVLLTDCKSAKKALKQGNYDQSVLLAVEKLRSNDQHRNSPEILKNAYHGALQQHLNAIDKNQSGSDPYRWEAILNDYQALNKLYDAISTCQICTELTEAKSYYNEEQSAREKATDIRYQEGNRLLKTGGRDHARKAFEHFEKVNSLTANYKNVNSLLSEAYEEASFKVVVEQVLVTSKRYQLSNEYFQQEIDNFLQTNKNLNKFVRFYTPEEATTEKLTPDHVITLQFDDFTVGQTVIDRHTKTVEKDSIKVGEKKVRDRMVPVYEKVKADFTTHKKLIHSSGLLDVAIREFQQNKLVQNKKFEGSFDWFCEWGTYKGDERALTPDLKKLSQVREQNPPPPQQLFVEFSKPIYNQLTAYLRNFYAGY